MPKHIIPTNMDLIIRRLPLHAVEGPDAAHQHNTSFHSESEAPGLPIPSERPYRYSRWRELIQRSRGILAGDVQTVDLTLSQTGTLNNAAMGSVLSQRRNRAFEEDIREEIEPALAHLRFPSCGLFVRLDACSAKDGASSADGGRALRTVDDVVLRLTTSQRASNALAAHLRDWDQDPKCQLTFLPFDSRLESRREYRVFCRPGDARLTAVSQYQWHRPWIFNDKPSAEQVRVIREIMRGVGRVHRQILGELKPATDEQDALLLRQGFTFDVFYDEGSGEVELVELNVFGARGACGSCLFHWIQQAGLLYGRQEMVEFWVVSQ